MADDGEVVGGVVEDCLGWVGGWVVEFLSLYVYGCWEGRGGSECSNEVLDRRRERWVGGWVGGWVGD